MESRQRWSWRGDIRRLVGRLFLCGPGGVEPGRCSGVDLLAVALACWNTHTSDPRERELGGMRELVGVVVRSRAIVCRRCTQHSLSLLVYPPGHTLVTDVLVCKSSVVDRHPVGGVDHHHHAAKLPKFFFAVSLLVHRELIRLA